jgi:hypothetical protein
MRRIAACLMIIVLGAWVGSLGQEAPVKGLQYPRIVAKVNLFAEHGSKSGIVFTPKKTGVYRFSAEIVPYKSAPWAVQANWYDELGHHQDYSCLSNCQVIGFLEIIIKVSGGSPITYSTSPLSGRMAGRYNMFIVLEQLE